MFDLDLGKMVLFGVVALVFVGPKELPAALRIAGRLLGQVRGVQAEIRKAANSLMADASLDREFAGLADMSFLQVAMNPATAMRGSLPLLDAPAPRDRGQAEALEYASPQMQAYLAPPPEAQAAPEGA